MSRLSGAKAAQPACPYFPPPWIENLRATSSAEENKALERLLSDAKCREILVKVGPPDPEDEKDRRRAVPSRSVAYALEAYGSWRSAPKDYATWADHADMAVKLEAFIVARRPDIEMYVKAMDGKPFEGLKISVSSGWQEMLWAIERTLRYAHSAQRATDQRLSPVARRSRNSKIKGAELHNFVRQLSAKLENDNLVPRKGINGLISAFASAMLERTVTVDKVEQIRRNDRKRRAK